MFKFYTVAAFLVTSFSAFPQGGQLDEGFGTGGKVTTNIIPSYDEWGYSTVVQPDGKILVAGYAYNGFNSDANFNVVRYNEDGTLDKTFGAKGRVTTDFNNSQDITSSGQALALQPDGKIIVAGTSANGSDNNFAVVRYNSNGLLDSTFGTAGKVTTDFGSTLDNAYSVAVQENGKIVVAGYAYDGINIGIALARYNSDGSLDPTLDTDGRVIINFGGSPVSAVIQPDGKIVAAGAYDNGSNYDFGIARFNSDGSLDGTFGTAGRVFTDFGSDDIPNSVTVQPDAKIVVAGQANNGTSYDFALARYNADGSLDLNFGSNGKVKTDISENSYDEGNSVLIQSDGKIILAGFSEHTVGSGDFTIARYNSDGTADNSFGTNGISKAGLSEAEAYSAALQPDGKIVLSGRVQTFSDGNDFAVVRFNDNGSLDNLFGSNGMTTTDMGNSTDLGYSIAYQNDGKIIVAGTSYTTYSNMSLARYNSDGTIDTSLIVHGRILNNMGASSNGNAVTVLPNNKIVVAGSFNNGSNNDFLLSRFNPDGSLDFSFPGGGNETQDLTGANDAANAVAVQSNGKIVLAGYALNGASNDFAVVRFNSDGSLDMAFDGDGIVFTDISSNSTDVANSVAIQQDGKIVVAGTTNIGTNYDLAVVRYNPDGSKDNSFDSDGIFTLDIDNSSVDYGNTVLIQPDQKIIVAGLSSVNSNVVLTLIRLNSNGSLDNTFGSGGKAVSTIDGLVALRNSAALQADGKIIVGGSINNGSTYNFVLLRYNTGGSIDSTFGSNGQAVIDFDERLDLNLSVLIQPDGKVVAAGASNDGFSYDFALARYIALFPIVNFSADALDFGNVKTDSSASKKFIIRNTGSAPFVIDSLIHRNNSFSVTAANLTIPQNDSTQITVTFTPGSASAFKDTLLVYGNASNHPDTISLRGTGTSGTTAPIIALSAGTINFPDLTVNSSVSRSLYIKNNGNAPLSVSNITSDNSVFTIDSTSFTVASSDSHKINITFTPAAAVSYNASLTITHNAAGNPSVVSLSGKGVSNPVAIFSLSANAVNFPSVTVNNSIQRSFYVRNEGTANLQITGISSSDTTFKIDSGNFTVSAKDSHKVTITFIPTQAKDYNASLTISYNASGSPASVNLSGKGTANPVAIFTISKTSLNFGTLFTGSSSTQFFYIKNEGVASLQVSQISSTDNAFTADTSAFTLPSKDSLKVTVSFKPSEAKVYNASLTIQHNAAGSPNQVNLAGTGFSYPASISLSVNKSFGSVDNSNNFRIVSVPGSASIPVQLTGNFDYDWSVYWDNGSDQNYLEHKSDFTFSPGKAYWVIGKNPMAISQQVNTVSLNTADFTYSIPLHPGWNLISNPFERTAQWSSIRNLNSLPANKVIYSWNGSWSNASEMKPYEGYYFYNDSTNLPSLKIPYEIGGSLGKKNNDNPFPSDPEKFLKLSIEESNDTELSDVFVGIDPGSSEGIDEKDYFSPPGDFQNEKISLLRNELPKREKYLFIEERPSIGEGQEFDLEIKSVPNQSMKIKIDGENNFKNYNIYLFDATLKNLYDIGDKDKFEFRSVHQFNPFKLFIGTDNYINEIKRSLLPLTHQLYQNYPNPFNPKTVIRFSLPKSEKISIKVFNILGELVTTLIDNQVFDAGSFEVEFNASRLSSGVYIASLEAPGFNAQKKMILLK